MPSFFKPISPKPLEGTNAYYHQTLSNLSVSELADYLRDGNSEISKPVEDSWRAYFKVLVEQREQLEKDLVQHYRFVLSDGRIKGAACGLIASMVYGGLEKVWQWASYYMDSSENTEQYNFSKLLIASGVVLSSGGIYLAYQQYQAEKRSIECRIEVLDKEIEKLLELFDRISPTISEGYRYNLVAVHPN